MGAGGREIRCWGGNERGESTLDSPRSACRPLVPPGDRREVGAQRPSTSAKKKRDSRTAFSSLSLAWIAFLPFDSA